MIRRGIFRSFALMILMAAGGCGEAVEAPPGAATNVELTSAGALPPRERSIAPATNAAVSKDEAPNPSVPAVEVARPMRRSLELTTERPGHVEPFQEASLYARLGGFVDRVHVDMGDRVTGPRYDSDGKETAPGQVLVEISTPEIVEQIAQKKALWEQAAAQVEQAQAQIKVAEAVVASGQSQVEQAAAQEEKAIAEMERMRAEYGRVAELGRSSAVSQKTVDENKSQFRAAEAARRDAAAKVQAAKSALVESEAQVEKARADEAAAQAAREVAAGDLRRQQILEKLATIRAPFDGVVVARHVAPGQLVEADKTPADRPLLIVVRTDPVRVLVDIGEGEAGATDVGDPVTIRSAALPGVAIEGAITRTSWALDATTRLLRAEIDVPNPDDKLRPGMCAIVKIVLAAKSETLTLPPTAIVQRGSQAACYVVRDGHAIETPVVVGLETGDAVEIVTGLSADDLVVVLGAANLKDGQAVVIGQEPAKS